MKISFYFVLWIVVYAAIYIFGSQFFQENAFLIALILAIFVFPYLLSKTLCKQIAWQRRYEIIVKYENIYSQNLHAFREHWAISVMFGGITTLFMSLCAVMLLLIRDSLWIVAVFAFLAFSNGRELLSSWRFYKQAKCADGISYPDDEDFMTYVAERRSGRTFEDMLPAATLGNKVFRWANIAFSIMSVILGLFIVIIHANLIGSSSLFNFYVLVQVLYGASAILYGVRDLTDCLSNKIKNSL